MGAGLRGLLLAVLGTGALAQSSSAQTLNSAVEATNLRVSTPPYTSANPPPAVKVVDEDAWHYIATQVDRENHVLVPMRDGIRLSATLLFSKGKQKENLPTILFFNPYDTDRVIRSSARYFASFLRNGYAVAVANSRGRYFSEGTYQFLVGSGNDGYDTIDWLSKQPWSNGKIGTFGCSSSAEEQHRMNAMGHPALAAAVPMSSGAGIGVVGPYHELGSFYRGGIVRTSWFNWYRNAGYRLKPSFPTDLSADQLSAASRYWSINPNDIPDARFDETIWKLPVNTIMQTVGSMPSDLDDFINYLPNDPHWKNIEFGGEGYRSAAPTLYINALYDLSIGPNVAMYQYQAKEAANQTARDNMFMVIAPTLHCQQGHMESEHTVIGQRDVGDARFDYTGLVQRWFDRWLKGIDNGVTAEPKVRVYTMGENAWRSYDSWPPKTARPITFYLDSEGQANSRYGNGHLIAAAPRAERADHYSYDPLHPVPSVGGQVCCIASLHGGAFDQADVNTRQDVLVYTTEPLTAPLEVTGPVTVQIYFSADVKDTDLIVNLIDVYPDGRAYNLDKGALRLRWREGYRKPALMRSGEVYDVTIPPLVTSNVFERGHRIQIAIASSSFPDLERNLNTGGNNFDEQDPVIAHNTVHHGPQHPSKIELLVISPTKAPRSASGAREPNHSAH